MILIITHKEDYTADYLIDKLNHSNKPYFRFNCEDYLSYDLLLGFGQEENISINRIKSFDSVWYRRTKLPSIKAESEAEQLYILREVDTLLANLFSIIDAKWLSHPNAVSRAENKLLQLSYAMQAGFNVPKTCITNNKKALLSFIKSNERTVIKPLYSGRVTYSEHMSKLIFTNILNSETINNIGNFVLTPAIYQEYIDKAYELRVTVVDKDIFAAKVDSQSSTLSSTDWRRHKLTFEKYDLPDELSDKCLALLKRMGISFGAFDFIRDTKGNYWFLEVNPNGQWVWIEKDTGMNISESIIKYLTC